MLGVSCLIRNTSLQQNLKDMVELIGYTRISEGKEASIASIYNDIRKAGIEVDLQTIGYLYNEVLPKDYKQFNSDQEVNDFILKTYNDAIQRAALLEPISKEQQVGEDSPALFVVNGILNMFTKANAESDITKSDMLKMQDALWKGVQRQLNLPETSKPSSAQQWKNVLNQALGYERLGLKDLNGKLNSIADLYNAMRDQLEQAKKDLSDKADYATMDRWDEMVNQLEASTYSLLFSRGEAKTLLEGIMKEAGFGKELKNGKIILNWNKLAGGIGSVQDVRSNVQRVLEDNGFNQDVVEGVKKSLENEFTNLQARILQKQLDIQKKDAESGEKELARKEKALDRSPADKKSDLKRLAELNNLGIFQSSHDRVLYNLIGVSDLEQQDIEDLKALADAASELYREIEKNYGSDIYATRQLQTLQRHINSIISRNIKNKSRLLKIVNGIKNFMDVFLSSLLMRPFTLLENLYSGLKEVVVPTLKGKGLKKEDAELYWRTLADVTNRGLAYGEEVGSFSPQELYTNTLKFKFFTSTVKEKAESILHAMMLPARVGLLGFDSANKVTITNKVFNNSIYQVLTQKGMNPEEATRFMNEALYGESFEQSKDRAKGIIELTNKNLPDKYKTPINKNTVAILANDLVKANLNANGALTNDVIEAAYKSSYHVAGYGLGHEANNYISKGVKGIRLGMQQKEDKLIKDKKWDELAWHRMKSTLLNGMILRFTGGATNWIYLRAQSGLGLGLVTGFMGKWNNEIDFKDKNSVKQSIRDIQNSRNKIRRGLVGISLTAVGYIGGYILFGSGDDEDKKKLQALKEKVAKAQKTSSDNFGSAVKKQAFISPLQDQITELEKKTSWAKDIKSSWMQSRLFKKVAPDALLFHYYMDTEKSHFAGALKYIETATGVGNQFSTDAKFTEAGKLAYKGDFDAANGTLASIAGDRFSVPIWSSYKDWFKLGKWISGAEVNSDFKAPTNIAEGLWGGGALEDFGLFNRDSKITILPGVGAAKYEKFKAKGIENMSDIEKNPKWFLIKDAEGNFILSETDRKKALDAAKKYEDQK